jgi:uncharacterized membrane protein YraQ (UPF0718 family)
MATQATVDPMLPQPLSPSTEGNRESTINGRLVRDINVMLAYALDEGLTLTPNVGTILDDARVVDGKVSLSSLPLPMLVELHGALVKAVAPTTPVSLEATMPIQGHFAFLRRPPVIGWMVLAALISLAALGASIAQNWQSFGLVSAAALGSAFYGLFTANEYAKLRTFDPRYNSVYMIRFFLGVIAGAILARIPIFSADGTLKTFGPNLIALLGGYSAEAVNQILQRLVEIMVATVKGSGADAAKAELEQTKTKLTAQLTGAKQAVSQDLADVMSNPNVPDTIRVQLKQIQDKLK